jgi:hypothetical protein
MSVICRWIDHLSWRSGVIGGPSFLVYRCINSNSFRHMQRSINTSYHKTKAIGGFESRARFAPLSAFLF